MSSCISLILCLTFFTKYFFILILVTLILLSIHYLYSYFSYLLNFTFSIINIDFVGVEKPVTLSSGPELNFTLSLCLSVVNATKPKPKLKLSKKQPNAKPSKKQTVKESTAAGNGNRNESIAAAGNVNESTAAAGNERKDLKTRKKRRS